MYLALYLIIFNCLICCNHNNVHSVSNYLRCGMYPAGKVDISQHLAIPGFPQSDNTVSKPSADAGSLCSEA